VHEAGCKRAVEHSVGELADPRDVVAERRHRELVDAVLGGRRRWGRQQIWVGTVTPAAARSPAATPPDHATSSTVSAKESRNAAQCSGRAPGGNSPTHLPGRRQAPRTGFVPQPSVDARDHQPREVSRQRRWSEAAFGHVVAHPGPFGRRPSGSPQDRKLSKGTGCRGDDRTPAAPRCLLVAPPDRRGVESACQCGIVEVTKVRSSSSMADPGVDLVGVGCSGLRLPRCWYQGPVAADARSRPWLGGDLTAPRATCSSHRAGLRGRGASVGTVENSQRTASGVTLRGRAGCTPQFWISSGICEPQSRCGPHF
jgi:hypothetical protein